MIPFPTQDAAMDRQLSAVLAAHPTRWQDAWRIRSQYHAPIIRFDRPSETLPVSLTGSACALQCAHCGGHYLRHMHPIWKVRGDGHRSLLISGGCDARGRVPVTQHLDLVARLRAGRRLNWHVGFIEEEEIRTIAPWVDVISFDIVGDRETAREVYHLDLTLDDYMRTFDMLRTIAPVVPHVTIGLRGGRLSGEYAALEALRVRGIEALILIIFIPTEGTAFADCAPPTPSDVADVLLTARMWLPKARLYLGCMRPHGAYRQAVDQLAVLAGLNAIVNPSHAAEEVAQERGLHIVWGDECCALD